MSSFRKKTDLAAGESVIFFRPCVLHGVRIVFQIRRLGIFKPCGEPCRIHSIVELLHMIKEGPYPQVGYAGILQKLGKKSLCIRICQIGVSNLLKDGLRSFLSAASCQKRTAKKCSGADKKSSTFQKWSPRCVFRKVSLSAGVSTISEESNAVGLVTNGITDKQRKSMTSVVFDHI